MASLCSANTGQLIRKLPEHFSSELTEVSPNGCEEGEEGLDHSLSLPNMGTVLVS